MEREKGKRVLRLAFLRPLLALIGATGLLGAAAESQAATERRALESRVESIREAISTAGENDPAKPATPPGEKTAQWYNWGNWGNWGNWPNWNNWGNWFNR